MGPYKVPLGWEVKTELAGHDAAATPGACEPALIFVLNEDAAPVVVTATLPSPLVSTATARRH